MPSDRDRVLTLILGWCGLRFSEAAGLTPSEVDVLRRRIRIERAAVEVSSGAFAVGSPKTHAARTVVMPGFVADAVGAYMNGPDSPGPLFPDTKGGYVRNTLWRRRVFAPAAARAGLTPPNLRVHDLRHTAASLAIRSGASLKVVQQQLGHRSATMTLDRYGHLFPDEMDGLGAALERLSIAEEVGRPADSVRTVEAPVDNVSTLYRL